MHGSTVLDVSAAVNSTTLTRLRETRSVIQEVLTRHDTLIVTFSGGKDSTLLAHLVVEELLSGSRHNKHVIILFNDTLAEIPFLHEWALRLGTYYEDLLRRNGLNAKFLRVKPRPQDTFYWRSIIDGYPAPTFKFRWCVTLLKIEPFRDIITRLASRVKSGALLSGVRDSESPARARSIASRSKNICKGEAGTCLAEYILNHDFDSRFVRYAPIRHLTDQEVWEALLSLTSPPGKTNIKYVELYSLYSAGLSPVCRKVRFGCWFCTVTSKHCGLRAAIEASSRLRDRYWREAMRALWLLRLLYRRVSDKPSLRFEKNKGYSKLGPLRLEARALLLQALGSVYKAFGSRLLYGLEEQVIPGVTLAQLFFTLEPTYAKDIVKKLDPSPRATTDFELLRDEDFVKRSLRRLPDSEDILSLYETILSIQRSKIGEDETYQLAATR